MIFVDSSAWIARELPADRRHEEALAAFRRARTGELGALVTSDYVMSEGLTIVRMDAGLEAAETLASRVFESPHVRLLWTTAPDFRSAWSLMQERRDKRWSLVDCVSFVHMAALGIAKAMTFDDNFAEAGYEVFPVKERGRKRPERA